MKILVVAAHPHLQQSKVNKAWIERLRHESSITLNDLHKEYPDKRIDVQKEQQLLLQHDRIVFQYPFYWYSAPAFLKQWMEEVLDSQWMMGEGGRGLAGKELVLAISAGSHEQAYQAGGFQGFSMSEFTKPMQALAGLIGMKFLPSFVFYGAAAASEDEVLHSAEQYAKHILDPKLDPRIRLMEAINREA